MSNYELKTENDFNGQISDLIKVVKACEKAGIQVKDVINILKRPDMKEALREINEYTLKKTETQRKIEQLKAQEERAKDFGIGEY